MAGIQLWSRMALVGLVAGLSALRGQKLQVDSTNSAVLVLRVDDVKLTILIPYDPYLAVPVYRISRH